MTDMDMKNKTGAQIFKETMDKRQPLQTVVGANIHCAAQSGSVTDKQRIDWLLQECEIRRLDDNGAPYGQDLMDRSEIDTEIQSQNVERDHE